MKSAQALRPPTGGLASENGGASTPPTFGKSYAFRSDHSLVTVLKGNRPQDKPNSSLDSMENDEDEDDLSYTDSEDSEAVLTRLHRFCWAICCCLCRSPGCCYNKKYYYDEDEAEAGEEDEVDSDKTSAVEELKDNSRCLWLFSIAACLCYCQQKFAEARTRFRQMMEFAEYGNGLTPPATQHQYFNNYFYTCPCLDNVLLVRFRFRSHYSAEAAKAFSKVTLLWKKLRLNIPRKELRLNWRPRPPLRPTAYSFYMSTIITTIIIIIVVVSLAAQLATKGLLFTNDSFSVLSYHKYKEKRQAITLFKKTKMSHFNFQGLAFFFWTAEGPTVCAVIFHHEKTKCKKM